MRIQYQKELELLHQELAHLGGLCADAIGETYQALRSGASDIYRAAKERGDQIRDLERTAEGRCIQLLLLQQPVASDLRRVSSALKMTTDLGRIGDNTPVQDQPESSAERSYHRYGGKSCGHGEGQCKCLHRE